MKNLIYLFACLFFVACQQKQETSNELPETDGNAKTRSVVQGNSVHSVPSSVAEIKQAYKFTIEQLENKQLDSILIKYDCDHERTGIITYFSHQGKLSMIRHRYNEYDHYSATDEYFVKDDTLFFAYFKSVLWSFESGSAVEGATKDNITEKRFYIFNQKPLQCLEKKYTFRSHAADNPAPETIMNKQVPCKTIEPIIKDFKRLLVFKNNSQHNCLEK
ncbi:hypothetical protein [Pedobacter chinensis]|nr:hypothetical protein [Pedobacter chinensis]